MQYPTSGTSKGRIVKIPQFNGGINAEDAVTLIQDNQLSDALNMWYMDGRLTTRPPAVTSEHFSFVFANTWGSVQKINHVDVSLDGKQTGIFLLWNTTKVCFLFMNEDGISNGIYSVGSFETGEIAFEYPCNIFEGKPQNGIGVFITVPVMKGGKLHGRFFEIREDSSINYSTYEYTDSEFYTPLVYINGKGDSFSTLEANEQTEYASASMYEGLSLLTDAYRATYLSDGVSKSFTLPYEIGITQVGTTRVYNVDQDLTVEVIVPVTTPTGYDYHQVTATIPAGSSQSPEVAVSTSENVLFVRTTANSRKIEIIYRSGSHEAAVPRFEGATNITVYAHCKDEPDYSMIYCCGVSTTFGGMKGIYGGSRSFLAGNPAHPNLLFWSSVNNPLYFSENTNVYVGSATQKITALAKQEDMLVIFKEHEMFYTTYVAGAGYSADDFYSGAVVDITTTDATFPIYQCHGAIGCDLPGTIQLCNNRLIWATKERRVYTLVTFTNTSERNVYDLSASIRNKIDTLSDSAFAVDWNEHYILFNGVGDASNQNKAYLLDYDKTGVKYVSSYSKTSQKNNMAWFIWQFENHRKAFVAGQVSADSFRVISTDLIDDLEYVYVFEIQKDSGYKDETYRYGEGRKDADISSYMATKAFDFDDPATYKNYSQIYIGLGNETDTSVAVSYATDYGQTQDIPLYIQTTADRYTAEYGTMHRLLPKVGKATRLMITVSAVGKLSVESLALKYKLLGDVR